MTSHKTELTPAIEARDAIDSQEVLLRQPVNDMDLNTVTVAWSILDHIEKVASKRKKELRARLMSEAEASGAVDAKGSAHLSVLSGGKVSRQRRESMKLVPGLVLTLLEEEGLDPTTGGSFDFKPDDKKLSALIAAGRLDPDKLADCAVLKETFALVVKKPREVQDMIDGGQNGKLGQVQPGLLRKE